MARPAGTRGPVSGWVFLGCAALAALFALVPGAFGFSGGIMEGISGVPAEDAWLEKGCVNCHGGGEFAPPMESSPVTVTLRDAEGNTVPSSAYDADAQYTITISLDEQNAPNAGNHAGFNLRVTAGELSAEGHPNVQVSGSGLQATHTSPGQTEWTVGWTAPHEGAVLFDVFVNDVNGDAAPDAGDQVHRRLLAFTDHAGAQLGAAEEHEVHVGVPLPQYWLGLIALAGMLGVMVFGYVYIKYMSPHHSDAKDR